jgi:hypothetical protein
LVLLLPLPLQIKDDWQAFAAALTPLLTPFGPYAAALNTLIVKLAKVMITFCGNQHGIQICIGFKIFYRFTTLILCRSITPWIVRCSLIW